MKKKELMKKTKTTPHTDKIDDQMSGSSVILLRWDLTCAEFLILATYPCNKC